MDRSAAAPRPALGEPPTWLFYLIFVWGACLRFYPVTTPLPDNFQGIDSGFMGMIARNWVRHGLWHLKFYQVMDGGPLVAGSEIYTHHPPLIPLSIWLWFTASGSFSEWCTRLPTILFSLGSLVLVYLVARRLWNGWVALLAGVGYALMPFATYFAIDPGCYETGSQFFFLLIFYWYVRYLESQRFRDFAFMCAALMLGALTDWPAFYAAPLLGLHWLWLFPGKRRLYFLLFPALAAVMGGVFLTMMARAEGTWLIPQIAALKDPSWVYGFKPHTASELFRVIVLDYLFHLCTPAVMVLAFLWLGGFFLRVVYRQASRADVLLFILLLFGMIHTVLGREWAYMHDYWASVLMPGLSLAAAVVAYSLFNTGAARYSRAGWAWKGLLYAALLLFGIFCTARFFRVLEERAGTDGYQKAKVIKENTHFEDHILTTTDVIGAIHIRFYADRNITSVTSVKEFAEVYKEFYAGASWAGGPRLRVILPEVESGPAYHYFFLPDQDQTNYPALYGFLKTAYRLRTTHGFTIFDLNDPLLSEQELSARLTNYMKN